MSLRAAHVEAPGWRGGNECQVQTEGGQGETQLPWRRGEEGSLGLVSSQYFPALPGSPGNDTSLKQLGRGGGDSQNRGQEA